MDTAYSAQHLIGKPVKHNAFGSGVVESLSGNVVTVNFEQGDKRFIYPDAFKNFLKFEDKEGKEEFQHLMDLRNRRIQEKKAIIREKEETKRKFRCKKMLVKSQIVFNLTEAELEESCKRGWANTGIYQSGFQEGRARSAGRVRPNSLCLLTSLKNGEEERERELCALYMAAPDFYGDEHDDGHVVFSDKYSLKLEKKNRIKLWNAADTADVPKRFGGIHFRYVGENSGLMILKAVKEKLGDEKKEFMDEFINYYCRLNEIQDTAE